MARKRGFAHVLLACYLLASLIAAGAYDYTSGDFIPGPPAEHLKSDAGFESAWGPDTKTLRDENLAAFILVMEPGTLRPPHYADADLLMAVLQGTAHAGIINDKGEETGVRRFRRGDVIALPAGWATWILNNDTEQKFTLLAAARPVDVPGELSKFEVFPLMAGEVTGQSSLLHGFTKDILAEAFNTDEDLVEQIQTKTPDSGLVKLGSAELMAMDEELKQRSAHDDSGLMYNVDEADPDFTSDFGQVTLLDCERLSILKNLSLGAVKVSLKPGAMLLPRYKTTATMFGFITAGRARVQVAQPDGSTGADAELGPGEAFVVPRFFPSTQKSVGDKKLEGIGFVSSAYLQSGTVFLAGKNSIYRAVPNSVLAAATQVDKAKIQQCVSNQPATVIAGREKGWFREKVETIVEEIREGLAGGVKEEVMKTLGAPKRVLEKEL
ncbi:RmlC-like cupins superfamily protein [Klebsormidium nitens]|uniref:RmlC-like cupins superfamily protein n=1 Tax=Klebsormidium nitens TaxID=105231 RepID=A0A1Y1I8S2_KLENI|nr:RmlC-like cupins superfamily protein [Klebsormidium nitens]|eukprot:GAQ84498.1 RmlC-like cupins superfamily protein [Klebsormidium nitens]